MLTFIRHRRGVVGVVLLCAISIVVVLFYLNHDRPKHNEGKTNFCQLSQQQCELNLPIGTVKVIITGDMQPEEPMDVQVSLPQGVTIDRAYVEGVNMYMGVIPIPLSNTSEGVWKGWLMVGSCSEPSMQWHMLIGLKGYEVPLIVEFNTSQP